ncbi:error-prone DNA polymerase [Amaricoccus sp.]|uniref:error-prone DNA polymerase n=1 Tax=Amaricoccus sp. TaxID=1872485 RepID=UPI002622CAD8|nr:error-prone DNA polymerase [Amaricoccus sp.]HRO12097.1 error-prone DNA polymerase [Amaricoccus sp.]
MPFAELCITSNFTFLTGGSHPQEYACQAMELGLGAFAIADRNSVAGLVRALRPLRAAARAEGGAGARVPRLLPATRLCLAGGAEITALPRDRFAWGRLCRLLSTGAQRTEKGKCLLHPEDLADLGAMHLLLHPPPDPPAPAWLDQARLLVGMHPGTHLVASPRYDGQDPQRLARLARLADRLGLPLVASAEPIMHRGARRRLVDVLTCIREGRRIDTIGRAAQANAERRLRSEAEMLRLLAGHEAAVHRAGEIADDCRFSLDELRYEYPKEIWDGEDPQARLARLTADGLRRRYPAGVPQRHRAQADKELALIARKKYAPFFLTVQHVVEYARANGILCQGRGSAANSIVCYALGITAISPDVGQMVFERFVSDARDEPPDIDVDFEHERREEVIQYIYEHFHRERAGICATVIHYRGKRAIREVGAAMGLSRDTVAALSSQIWGWGSGDVPRERLIELGLDPEEPRLKLTLQLVNEIVGFPRHLSQHVGGFVITEGRLDELVPIENAAMEDRTVICWDKDDIECLGILKVDVLALGMLTCIRKAFDLLADHGSIRHDLDSLPKEDPAVYDMLCRADAIGVFQVESRAQLSFLPRMRPREFYDLVIEVAIVRPGPIQGGMVHPYLRRRREKKVSYPSEALEEVLKRTLGVPLFQEQAMQVAIVGAGFTPDEADRLRRSLGTFKGDGTVYTFHDRFLSGMAANGYDRGFAERCFEQIKGFGSYGFPESHAASFALLVYASAWLKCHHPAVFACALLNSQPMGFYAPAQIVRDVREHGVEVRPVCINASAWDNGLEPDGRGGLALRLGFRQIRGVREAEALRITKARGNNYRDVAAVWRRAAIPPRTLALLAGADGFAALGLDRREALWQVRAIGGEAPLPLFSGIEGEGEEERVSLPAMTLGEEIVADHVALRLSLRAHPMALVRPRLAAPRA